MQTAFAHAAAAFQPRPRRWPTPGAMAIDLDRTTRQTPALDIIDQALVALYDHTLPTGDGNLLGLFMPPQEGKSQRTSRRFPVWALHNDPTLRIGLVSYSAEKAIRWGRATRRDVQADPRLASRIRIRPDSRSAEHWETEAGGGIVCAGIEGGITGEPLDVLVIDDPVRGRAEAESLTYRENAWDIWESNLSTRASERFCAVLMMTRWHEDDLAGRFQAREPGRWHYVSIPAIADSPNDPLGRQLGEEMASARGRQAGYFRDLQARRSPYVFSSIYQQRPVPAEGGLFPRASLGRFWRFAPDLTPTGARWLDLLGGERVSEQDMWRFMTVDTASTTRTSSDWTVAAVWGVTRAGDLVLLDQARARADMTLHASLVLPLARRWAVDYVGVEDAKHTLTLARDLGRADVTVKPLQPVTDKVTRAIPAANRVKAGGLWLPADAPWLDDWLDEVTSFPNAAHDDQVDALAYAALELDAGRAAPAVAVREPGEVPGRYADGVAGLHLSGMGATATNYDTATW